MVGAIFTKNFKRDTAVKVADWGYLVREFVARLGAGGQHQIDLQMAKAVFATSNGDQASPRLG